VGASGWEYVVPYQEDLGAALDALRRQAFVSGEYLKPSFYGDVFDLPEPGSVDDLFEQEQYWEFMGTSVTHSIIDVTRVVPVDFDYEEFGTIVPLGVPVEIDVLAGQWHDHELSGAQRCHLRWVFVLSTASGVDSVGEDLPQWRALLGAFQHEEGIPLAEARGRRPLGSLQQPVHGAWCERLAGERADHFAALDHLCEFHAGSVDQR
jgi:hypothetical protein